MMAGLHHGPIQEQLRAASNRPMPNYSNTVLPARRIRGTRVRKARL